MDNINIIRRQLLRIFHHEAVNEQIIQEPQLELEIGMTLNDLDTNMLVQLTIPFILGVSKNSKEEIINFIRTVLKLDIDAESIIKPEEIPFPVKHGFGISTTNINENVSYKLIFENILEGKLSRESKIRIGSIAKFELPPYIEWDCKSFIKSLLEACLCFALLQLRTILNEEEILESKRREKPIENFYIDDKKAGTQIYNILECGHLKPIENCRKDLLKRRITPTKTLDEYVASLQDNIKNEIDRKPGKSEFTAEKQRRKDDLSDLTRNFRGNTKNIG
ncbi:hypothetical protein GINT2_000588 [Glugoides intestinalis]